MHPARRPIVLAVTLLALLCWSLGGAAFADRIGKPFRGPKEKSATGSGLEGDPTPPVESDPEGDPGDPGTDPDAPGSDPVPGTTPDIGGKVAKLDGDILWAWWWEHNKDRYIARVTAPGRVQAGSAYYWFGAGAKFPPREIKPVSARLRATRVYPALAARVKDNDPRVRAEACIALGRIANAQATKKQRKEGQSDNLVVRTLIAAYGKNSNKEVKASALLGLGMTGSEDACSYIMRRVKDMPARDRAYAYIALGLAQHLPAIDMLLDALPKSARRTATDDKIAALHAIGLFGSGEEVMARLDGKNAIERIEKLADRNAKDTRIATAAIATLGRLQRGQKTVLKAFKSKTNYIQWNALLTLGYYSNDDPAAKTDTAAASAKLLMTQGFRAGKGQHKNFSILALGELASRLDPNSKTRERILKFLRDKGLGSNNRYVAACAAIAVGCANDQTATEGVADLLRSSKMDDWVMGAACVSLGLLRSTEHADMIVKRVLDTKRWNDDARGYALVGLGLMGNTTLLGQITKARTTGSRGMARQVSLALGILGDRRNVGTLTWFFKTKWQKKWNHRASNAAFAFAWDRDQSGVRRLVRLMTSNEAEVRGMETIALGYLGAMERVSPLTRSYEVISYRGHFGGWKILQAIAGIL